MPCSDSDGNLANQLCFCQMSETATSLKPGWQIDVEITWENMKRFLLIRVVAERDDKAKTRGWCSVKDINKSDTSFSCNPYSPLYNCKMFLVQFINIWCLFRTYLSDLDWWICFRKSLQSFLHGLVWFSIKIGEVWVRTEITCSSGTSWNFMW